MLKGLDLTNNSSNSNSLNELEKQVAKAIEDNSDLKKFDNEKTRLHFLKELLSVIERQNQILHQIKILRQKSALNNNHAKSQTVTSSPPLLLSNNLQFNQKYKVCQLESSDESEDDMPKQPMTFGRK